MTVDFSAWTLVARLSLATGNGFENDASGVVANSSSSNSSAGNNASVGNKAALTSGDLQIISQGLGDQGIVHHIELQQNMANLWIEDKQQAARVIQFLDYLQSRSQSQQVFNITALKDAFVELCYHMPVVASMILGSILGSLLVRFHFDLVHYFTFQDFIKIGAHIGFYHVEDALKAGEYWRIITPVFLHFGIFHLLFNCLWIWELGRRIEKLSGSLHLLGVALITGIVANVSQFAWSGASLFGGMSGVVYGLLGYIWIRNMYAPHPMLRIQTGIILFMLGWLVICMTGLIGLFMQGDIANAAHVGGLLSGMALGWWAGRR